MGELSNLWIQWRGETDWHEVQVRTVSVRAAFAFLADPPPQGTQGLFEARSGGEVLRRGVCRVVFVRDGVGAGLELRRAVTSSGSHSAPPPPHEPPPPSSQFGRSKSDRPPSTKPAPPRSAVRSPEPPGMDPVERSRQAVTHPGIRRLPPTEPEIERPESEAPPAGPTIDTGLDVGDLEIDMSPASGFSSKPPEGLELDLDERPAKPRKPSKPLYDPSDFIQSKSDEIIGRPGPAPPSDHPPPSSDGIDVDAEIDLTPPTPVGSLPSVDIDEPPPPMPDIASLPPIELDDGPLRPPTPAPGQSPPVAPEPALPTFDEGFGLPPDDGAGFGLPDFEPPTIEEEAPPAFENYERAVSESQRPPSMEPEWQPPGSPSGGHDPVRIETRTRGRGTTEGFAIGIDLGTSNTCASVVLDGVPQVIPTRYGTHTVPSVYARVGHRVLVGEPAVKRMVLDPRETIYGSKRLIGRAYTDSLAYDYQPYFAYQLAETRDHRFGAAIDGDVVPFEEVATALLEEVRDVASRFLGGPIDRAVITVPAYFTEVQREAVKRAARAARIMVDQLVPEPTAAALAFGHHSARKGNYVVFDLGGGTFDISVMRADEGDFQVLAIGGDPFLGGIDIDDMIANYLLEELHREIRERIDPTPQQLARLREVAEECKRGLSVQETFAVSLKHFAELGGRPVDLNATVSRTILEQLAGPYVARLLEITQETVAAAGLAPDDVHELILVGGMSRMPLVHKHVEAFFHRRADRKTNPDEAVAIGAALLASRIREVSLIDVLPLSIGIAGEGRRFLRLVPRNTSLPTTKSFVVRTDSDQQTRYELPLYQGERRDAARNEYLGTVIIEGLTPREAGRAIDLELQLDDQAVLSVVARDGLTGSMLDVNLSRDVSATEARDAQDDYAGSSENDDGKSLASPLGRFFQKVRGFFG